MSTDSGNVLRMPQNASTLNVASDTGSRVPRVQKPAYLTFRDCETLPGATVTIDARGGTIALALPDGSQVFGKIDRRAARERVLPLLAEVNKPQKKNKQ